jgi:hypothetical protein
MPVITGFCKVEVKPFGPVQLQLVAFIAEPVRASEFPAQSEAGDAEAIAFEGMGHVAQNMDCHIPFTKVSKQFVVVLNMSNDWAGDTIASL